LAGPHQTPPTPAALSLPPLVDVRFGMWGSPTIEPDRVVAGTRHGDLEAHAQAVVLEADQLPAAPIHVSEGSRQLASSVHTTPARHVQVSTLSHPLQPP